MAIRSDNPIEQEIVRQKAAFEIFKRRVSVFTNTFKSLSPRERSKTIQELQNGFKIMSVFLDRIKNEPITNSGSRFIIDNLRQSYASLSTQWRKFEKKLESDSSLAGRPIRPDTIQNPVDKAVTDFKNFMKNNAQNYSEEQLSSYKNQIQSAFENIETQTGKSNHHVNMTLEKGQLKIKILSD